MVIFGLIAFLGLRGMNPQTSERLFEGLGQYHRPSKCSMPLAKKFIDQGFAALYGFDYPLAERAFREAVRLEPNQVIGYYGQAMAKGNSINEPDISKDDSKAALAAIEKARQNRSYGTQEENELVNALALRFSPDGPKDRLKLDRAYSDAMREVWRRNPKDPDVGALFAESILNLRPWKQWTLSGEPEPGTEEAMSTIRAVLDLNPKHPHGLHLWIHVIEGSKHPERALKEANRLLDLQPDLDHMQHMPAHIFNRTGDWKKAIEANTKSIAIYRRLVWKGTYLDYAHARHSLAYAAAMRGQSELAIHHASQIFEGLGDKVLRRAGSDGDYYAGMRIMFMIRFGKWKEILAAPAPFETYKFSIAMLHEARAVAHAALGDVVSAKKEQSLFQSTRPDGEKSEIDTDAKATLTTAEHVMNGEILVAENRLPEAIAELRQAVKAEDAIPYGEPPIWIVPTRHTLGAALLKSREYSEAESVYREDLANHPNNGWSLYGLFRSLQGQKKDAEASRTLELFKKAWVDADFEITSSCLCMPEKN